MNKKNRALATILLTATLLIVNTIFPRGGGRGGASGRGFGGGGHSGGRSGGRSWSHAKPSGSRGNFAKRSNAIGSHRKNRNGRHGNNTNINVNGGGYGRSGYGGYGYGAGWVAPFLATTAIAETAVAAGSAASSASAANRAAGSAERSANAANQAANQSRQRRGGMNRNNWGENRENRINPVSAPSNREDAVNRTQTAQPVTSRNPQRTTRAINRQSHNNRAPAGGTSSRDNRPNRFNVDGHKAYGFYHNNNFYPTWFWGGIPYYWYGGLWSPWTDFWNLYPWWYDYYYTAGDSGISRYEADQSDIDYEQDDSSIAE